MGFYPEPQVFQAILEIMQLIMEELEGDYVFLSGGVC